MLVLLALPALMAATEATMEAEEDGSEGPLRVCIDDSDCQGLGKGEKEHRCFQV